MAIKHIKRLSKKDSNALVVLGRMYLEGVQTQKDEKKAFKLFCKAAYKRKNPRAFTYLGYMYAKGIGTKASPKHAQDCYNIAAKNGDELAMYTKSVCYSLGLVGMKADPRQREMLLNKPKVQRVAFAKFDRANLLFKEYMEGNKEGCDREVLDQKRSEAISLYESAIEGGVKGAMLNRGLIHLMGWGETPDYQKAISLIKSVLSDFAMAKYALGYMYEKGLGLRQNLCKAFELYSQSYEGGIQEGGVNMGYCMLYGIGTEKDENKAFSIFARIGGHNIPSANYFMGMCYNRGMGVKANSKLAKEYFEKAARADYAPARYEFGVLDNLGNEADYLSGMKTEKKDARDKKHGRGKRKTKNKEDKAKSADKQDE